MILYKVILEIKSEDLEEAENTYDLIWAMVCKVCDIKSAYIKLIKEWL